MSLSFRADHVGSLLRPAELLDARRSHISTFLHGRCGTDDFSGFGLLCSPSITFAMPCRMYSAASTAIAMMMMPASGRSLRAAGNEVGLECSHLALSGHWSRRAEFLTSVGRPFCVGCKTMGRI